MKKDKKIDMKLWWDYQSKNQTVPFWNFSYYKRPSQVNGKYRILNGVKY